MVTTRWFIAAAASPSTCCLRGLRSGRALVLASCRLRNRRPALRQAFQIEYPADQLRFLLHPPATSASESSEPVPVLCFAEQFLDELSTALRELVARAASPHANPCVGERTPAPFDGDVRFDAAAEDGLDEVLVKEPLVGAERRRAKAQPLSRPVEQRQTALLFRRHALEHLHAQPEQNAMSVLHERIHGVARIGARPRTALRHVPP